MKKLFARFARDRAGSTGVVYALTALPVIAVIAAATDYGLAASARARLQNAADAGLLMAANAAAAGETNASALRPKIESWLATQVADIAPRILELRACQSGADCATSSGAPLANGQIFLRVAADAPRGFSRLLPVGGASIPVHAQATSDAGGAGYIDIHFLVDVSASMGLGASPADQAGMKAAMGCAFACHGNGTVTQAHALGYTLRLDAVKAAMNDIAVQARSLTLNNPGGRIRFAIHAFANGFRTVLPLSANYGAVGSVDPTTIIGAIAALDTATYDAGTSTPQALAALAPQVAPSGDGRTPATPKTFVVLASDGVANAVKNDSAGGWAPDPTWLAHPPRLAPISAGAWATYINFTDWSNGNSPAINAGVACPNYVTLENSLHDPAPGAMFSALPAPCIAHPYWTSATADYWTGTVIGVAGGPSQDSMFAQPIDPEWCRPVKDRGAVMMTLYTTYVAPTPPEQAYVNYVNYAVTPHVAGGMRSCASSAENAFQASNTTEIHAAFQSIMSAARGRMRLVN